MFRLNSANKADDSDRKKLIKDRFYEMFGVFRAVIFPDGFRHYENFDTFKQVFPMKNMNHYISELNSICDFDTYVKLMMGHFNQYKKIGLLSLEFSELGDKFEYLLYYFRSREPSFMKELQESYKKAMEESSKSDHTLTLLNVIESISFQNVTIEGFPNFKEALEFMEDQTLIDSQSGNEALFRMPDITDKEMVDFSSHKLGPFNPINPLKANIFDTPITSRPQKEPRMMKRQFVNLHKRTSYRRAGRGVKGHSGH